MITADGSYRRGQIVPLKRNVDHALRAVARLNVIVLRRLRDTAAIHVQKAAIIGGRLMADAPAFCEPEVMDSEDPLFILYTSGTTAKPKGILHTTAGYLLGTSVTHKWVFDVKEEDVFWCTADIGWVTGHSYIVYGPLANGTTSLMYEGSPDWPEKDRWWSMIEKYRVNILYTAPTAIRAFMRWGEKHPDGHDLSSLRLLGSVGEPINPEAWMWYHEVIGKGRCPIVDTWWQTETGMILISALPRSPRPAGVCDVSSPRNSEPMSSMNRVIGPSGRWLPGLEITLACDGADDLQRSGPLCGGLLETLRQERLLCGRWLQA